MKEETKLHKQDDNKKNQEHKELPRYVPPKIVTYTNEEILEQIGPAQACSPFDPDCISYGG